MLYAFARYGGARFLDRHPRFFGLSAQRRTYLESWFRRPAGESLVFALRLLPFLRAAVSIPAGLARMDVGKFTLYSAAGSFVFNAVLAYSAYAVRTRPDVAAEVRAMIAYATSRWLFFLALALISVVAAYLLYRRRRAYRRAPHLAVRHLLRASAVAAFAAGLVLLGFSIASPDATYRALTWIAVDAGRVAEQYDVSALPFVLGAALAAITAGLVVLTASPFLERLTRRIFERVYARSRKGGSP
jgi:hypothetical protein